ncbi:CBO0543 family protein [Litchfieldia alkalitelluris]|uniref:CBO0543 family protein n=1 Tax=Litchfieldia alkalitelluris TaxID=304268 RepID=UPI001F41EB78|nr:CBO0543 family protein [Litchfieldia alkalitelluris]
MNQEQLEMYNKLKDLQGQVLKLYKEYWHLYSDISTWQFWLICLLFFLGPLVTLFFLLDRENKFLLGFYGLNVHIWFSYIDIWGSGQGLWGYPYKFIPFLPGNLSLDAALIPTLFMLVYQWTLKHKKNYYLYTIILSLFLSFIFKPLLNLHTLFLLHKGTNYLHLLLGYIVVLLMAKVITNVFIKLPDIKRK